MAKPPGMPATAVIAVAVSTFTLSELRSDIRPARTPLGAWKSLLIRKQAKASLCCGTYRSQHTIRAQQNTNRRDRQLPGNTSCWKRLCFQRQSQRISFFLRKFFLSQQTDSVYNIDIPLQPIEANATIVATQYFLRRRSNSISSRHLLPSSIKLAALLHRKSYCSYSA